MLEKLRSESVTRIELEIYDHVRDFTEDIALVSTRERGLGYIDRRGQYVWGPFH